MLDTENRNDYEADALGFPEASDKHRPAIVQRVTGLRAWMLELRTARQERASKAAIADRRKLHTMPYDDFLETKYWRTKRREVYRWFGGKCAACGSDENLHVHHKTYRRRGFEKKKDLMLLCAVCHKALHENAFLALGKEGDGSERRVWDEMSTGQRYRARQKYMRRLQVSDAVALNK